MINSLVDEAEDAERYSLLLDRLHAAQVSLLEHPVYEQISDPTSLRVFMESHVFAVWDFMTLLKSLQRRLTCVDVPWLPPADVQAARLINEIVLTEETDELVPGHYSSHFDLYLAAMEEADANTVPILEFTAALRAGLAPMLALMPLPVPESTKTFVLNTLEITSGDTHEVAAAFLFGRENIIPAMFRLVLNKLEQSRGNPCHSFRLYLDRHIHLDEIQHAPMAERLLKRLCGNDPLKWNQVLHTAHSALSFRHSLWDGVMEAIQGRKEISIGRLKNKNGRKKRGARSVSPERNEAPRRRPGLGCRLSEPDGGRRRVKA